MREYTRWPGWVLAVGLVVSAGAARAQSEVTALRAPFDGLRPQAAEDAQGVLHVVQATQASRTDLVYTRREPYGTAFSEPIRVNSTLNADVKVTQDSYALVSSDLGRSFAGTLLEPWELAGCPGALGSVTSAPTGTFVAWRTEAVLKMTKLNSKLTPITPKQRMSRRAGANTRVPSLASNHVGEVLFLWVETGGPKSKGARDVAWKLVGGDGSSVLSQGQIPEGASTGWGAPTAHAKLDGSFEILYDGEGE